MIKQLKYKNIVWLDVTNPTREEIASLAGQHSLHPMIEEELGRTSSRSKIDWYDDYIYLVLHFPIGPGKIAEIDFVLGKDWLITAHYEIVQPLLEFAQIFELGGNGKKEKGLHAGHLFYYIIRELYQPLENELDSLNRQLKQIEEKIFSGKEVEMVRSLSQVNRELLDIKWSLKFHRDILLSLSSAGKDFYGEKFAYYLNAILGEYDRVAESLKNNREIFSELHSTNESLLTIKNGYTMRILTVLAFIFLPVSLISFIFSMSGSETVVGPRISWYGILGLMAIAALITTGIAKYKKWI